MARVILSRNCKLYRNTGTKASPSWNEITSARDVTLSVAWQEADVSKRGSLYRQTIATQADVSLTFDVVRDADDTDQSTLLTKLFNGDQIELAVAEGAIATGTTNYFRHEFITFGLDKAEALADAKRLTFNMKLGDVAPSDETTYYGWQTTAGTTTTTTTTQAA